MEVTTSWMASPCFEDMGKCTLILSVNDQLNDQAPRKEPWQGHQDQGKRSNSKVVVTCPGQIKVKGKDHRCQDTWYNRLGPP